MKKIKPIRSPVPPFTKREVQLCFNWLVDPRAQSGQIRNLITKCQGKFVKNTAINDVQTILRNCQLKKSNLDFMSKKFQLTTRQIATVSSVSERTYRGWERTHHLPIKVSEHVLNIVEVYRSGMRLYENNERSFITWMNLEIPALGHKVPVNMMISSGQGAKTVNNLLCCMEYGILF